MFYSYEILTQRKYGVATVWLVATLGSKSSLKRVQRKDILSVDVPKACDTIIHTEAPMALRLQSNLLYGVARCFSQQCQYFYQDVAHVHANIRKVYCTSANTVHLDLPNTKARSDQLILPDDPTFQPGAYLNLPSFGDLVDSLDIVSRNLLEDSLATIDGPFRSPEHQGLPPQSSPLLPRLSSRIGSALGQRYTIPGTSDTGSGVGGLVLPSHEGGPENEFFEDPDFEFDEDGMIRELEPNTPTMPKQKKEGGMRVIQDRNRLVEDSGMLEQVIAEHEEALHRDLDLGIMYDLQAPPTDVQGYHVPGAVEDEGPVQRPLGPDNDPEQGFEYDVKETAPKKRRAPRKIPVDSQLELKNADLGNWRDNYLDNMQIQNKKKHLFKSINAARANAKKILFEWGINGALQSPDLKALFSGKSLLDAFAGANRAAKDAATRKRTASPNRDERRVRVRGDQGEAGLVIEDELPIFEPDGEEIARNAQEGSEIGLGTFMDSMPWDRPSVLGSASKAQERSAIYSSGGLGSIGGGAFLSSSIVGPASLYSGSRRGSRVSASPLFRRDRSAARGLGFENLNIEDDQVGQDEEELYLGGEEDGGFGGLGPLIDSQDRGTQWLMERESYNFLEYAKNEIAKREGNRDDKTNSITLNELIPPHVTGTIVAAQALQHTLLLATRGIIRVHQPESYGDIHLYVSGDELLKTSTA